MALITLFVDLVVSNSDRLSCARSAPTPFSNPPPGVGLSVSQFVRPAAGDVNCNIFPILLNLKIFIGMRTTLRQIDGRVKGVKGPPFYMTNARFCSSVAGSSGPDKFLEAILGNPVALENSAHANSSACARVTRIRTGQRDPRGPRPQISHRP